LYIGTKRYDQKQQQGNVQLSQIYLTSAFVFMNQNVLNSEQIASIQNIIVENFWRIV